MLLFPFGELVVFTVILASVNKLEKGKKVSLIAVLTTGIFLAISTLLVIITVGVDAFHYSNFPMLSAARLVSIGHFLERIDVIVVFIMTLGVITKVSVYIYCGVKGVGVYFPATLSLFYCTDFYACIMSSLFWLRLTMVTI